MNALPARRRPALVAGAALAALALLTACSADGAPSQARTGGAATDGAVLRVGVQKDGIRSVLRRCPPDLVADIGDRGIVLAGESATMPGLETMLRTSVGLPVHIAERPDVAAVVGLGSMIEKGAPPESVPDATSGPAGFPEATPTPAPQAGQAADVPTEVATD